MIDFKFILTPPPPANNPFPNFPRNSDEIDLVFNTAVGEHSVF